MSDPTCGIDNPSMIAQKPNRLPRAVFVSTAIWIHLLSVSARSRSSWQVKIVTATSSFIHSVRSIRSWRNCLPCSSVISSKPVQLSGLSLLSSSFSVTIITSVGNRKLTIDQNLPKINPISTLVRWVAITLEPVSLSIMRNVLSVPLSSGLYSQNGSISVLKFSRS